MAGVVFVHFVGLFLVMVGSVVAGAAIETKDLDYDAKFVAKVGCGIVILMGSLMTFWS